MHYSLTLSCRFMALLNMRFLFFFIVSLLSTSYALAEHHWFTDNITPLSVEFGGGVLNKNDYNCTTVNIGANIFGIVISADMGMEGGSEGEHVYGPGGKAKDPVLYQLMFGSMLPIYGNLHKKDNGFVFSITPLYGIYMEDYEYSDNYYGQPLNYDSSYSSSYGAIISLRFGRNFGMQYNAQITNHGWNISVGIAFGMY